MELKKQDFIKIINQNTGTIRSLCRVYYRSSEDQKDAFQDVILQLWKSFATFRGESEINTWIYRVSLNTIFNKLRSDKKSVAVESIDTTDLSIPTAGADDNLELLQLVIQSLKDIDKAIVILYLEGYQSKEIAEILNITSTNVTTRFNRIKSQLKLKFNNESHATK